MNLLKLSLVFTLSASLVQAKTISEDRAASGSNPLLESDQLQENKLMGQFDGGKEGGGGNTLNGRPIEAYIGDVKSYTAYDKYIVPLMDEIDEKMPTLSFAMRQVIEDKFWYFIPLDLDKIPRRITGIQFPSNQTMIQRRHSVWVSTPAFDQMLEEDQALLILHEMVVGIWAGKDYWFWQPDGPLNPDDYDQIRKATQIIWRSSDLSPKELRESLSFYSNVKKMPLLKYEFNSDNFSLGSIYDYLVETKELGLLLKTTYTWFTYETQTDCRIRMNFSDEHKELNIEVSYVRVSDKRSNNPKIGKPDNPTSLQFQSLPILIPDYSTFLAYLLIEGDAQAKNGEFRRAVEIWDRVIDGHDSISNFTVKWMACEMNRAQTCHWRELTNRELKLNKLEKETIRDCVYRRESVYIRQTE